MKRFMTVVRSLADIDGTNGVRFDGDVSFARIGNSISAKGDFDNDGLFDLAFGGLGVGHGTLVFGSAFAGDAEIDLENRSSFAGFEASNIAAGPTRLNISAGFVGDINNDGIDDIAFSSFSERNLVVDNFGNISESTGLFGGVTAFIFGSTTPSGDCNLNLFSSNQGIKYLGINESGSFTPGSGETIASIGDINGDGIADAIIGQRNAEARGTNDVGRAFVVFGKTGNTEDAKELGAGLAKGFCSEVCPLA
jgi:hypothetical protein